MRVTTQRTLQTGTYKIHICAFLKQTHMRHGVYRHNLPTIRSKWIANCMREIKQGSWIRINIKPAYAFKHLIIFHENLYLVQRTVLTIQAFLWQIHNAIDIMMKIKICCLLCNLYGVLYYTIEIFGRAYFEIKLIIWVNCRNKNRINIEFVIITEKTY